MGTEKIQVKYKVNFIRKIINFVKKTIIKTYKVKKITFVGNKIQNVRIFLVSLVDNEEKNLIAIFKRSTGEFITLCEPDDDKRENLLQTGNFGGQLGWFSGQAKNVPPKGKAEQNVADEITLIDSFESHVMGITPAPAYEFSSVDEGQNPGFTPLTSFESDVMGITPLDSSSSDYQI